MNGPAKTFDGDRRTLCILSLVLLVGLAGCTVGLRGQEGPVPVIVNNSANVTHTFDIWVAEGELTNKQVTIHKRDDTDFASPGPGLSTYKLDDDYGYVTSIELPSNRSWLHERYTLEPGESNRTTIENFETGSTVIVTISRVDRVISLVAAHCDGELAFIEVTMRYYGSDSAYNCQGGFF